MKQTAVAALVGVGLLIGLAPGGATGAADAKRACDSINLGGTKVFYKQNMSCSAAKRKARKVYESRGDNEPRRFNCQSGSGFEDGGACQHVSKDKYFGWHPID